MCRSLGWGYDLSIRLPLVTLSFELCRIGAAVLVEGKPLPSRVGFFWEVWYHHSARSAPPRPPGKQNGGTRPECQVQKSKQNWFFLSPLPLFLWKGLSSWLYTTGISLIEKKRVRKAQIFLSVLTIQFSKITSSCLAGFDAHYVPDANIWSFCIYRSPPCFRDVF